MSRFEVAVTGCETVRALDNAWQPSDYAALLEAAEVEGVSVEDVASMAQGELEEMCLMALDDLGPVQAAALVLQHRLGDRLRKGQISVLAQDFGDEKPWETHADMSLHEPLFHVGELLWRAMPAAFQRPDAVRLTLEILAGDAAAQAQLAAGLDEVLLVRLIADGLPAQALLHRLFGEQLERGAFAEASAIVWTWTVGAAARGSTVGVVGSNGWLGALGRAAPWVSDATVG